MIDDHARVHIASITRPVFTGPLIGQTLVAAPRTPTRATTTDEDAEQDRYHTRGGIPIPVHPAARSRRQGWPEAARRAPALTTARTAKSSNGGMPKQPRNATMSQATC